MNNPSIFDICNSHGTPWVHLDSKIPQSNITEGGGYHRVFGEPPRFVPFIERANSKHPAPECKLNAVSGLPLPIHTQDLTPWYYQKKQFQPLSSVLDPTYPDRGFTFTNTEIDTRDLVHPDGVRIYPSDSGPPPPPPEVKKDDSSKYLEEIAKLLYDRLQQKKAQGVDDEEEDKDNEDESDVVDASQSEAEVVEDAKDPESKDPKDYTTSKFFKYNKKKDVIRMELKASSSQNIESEDLVLEYLKNVDKYGLSKVDVDSPVRNKFFKQAYKIPTLDFETVFMLFLIQYRFSHRKIPDALQVPLKDLHDRVYKMFIYPHKDTKSKLDYIKMWADKMD